MEAIFKAGSANMLSSIAVSACRTFKIACSRCSFDTTSISVWVEYSKSKTNEAASEQDTVALYVTYGHSKEHNPDLKQIMKKLSTAVKNGSKTSIKMVPSENEEAKEGRRVLLLNLCKK